MSLDKLANQFLKLVLARRDVLTPEEHKLLLKINNSPSHYLAVADMTPGELTTAYMLSSAGFIERVPAYHGVNRAITKTRWGDEIGSRQFNRINRALPDRYVMLAAGDHILGTFEFDTLREEKRRQRRRHIF